MALSSVAPVIKDAERYKTTMCANWVARGACPYGPRCQFAHGELELRKRPQKPMQPPNAWMRAKGKPSKTAASATVDEVVPAQHVKPDTLQVLSVHRPCEEASMLARHIETTSQPVAAMSPPLSSPTLFAYAPIDAMTSASAPAAASPLCCNQTTGRVEACVSDTGCTEPALVRRGPSYSTQLVRRTVSFLFEGEPELAKQKSAFGATHEYELDQCGSSLFYQELSNPKTAAASAVALPASMRLHLHLESADSRPADSRLMMRGLRA